MRGFTALLSITAAGAWAQPAIAPPHLGFIADQAHSIRPVYGLAGNFVLGAPAATGVVSAAFSGSFGLMKTDSAIVAFDQQGRALASIDVPAGPALFAFSPDGLAGLVYIASGGEFLRYSAGTFTALPFDPGSPSTPDVVSVAWRDPSEASLIVQRRNGLWTLGVRLPAGEIVSQVALNGVRGPVLALASGELVASDSSGILLTKPDGSELHIAAKLPARFSLQQMSAGWVEITELGGPGRFAVRLTPGHEGFYALPEARQ